MKPSHRPRFFTLAALAVALLPVGATAGPDAAPRLRRSELRTPRFNPPALITEDDSNTTVIEAEEIPLQPLRQREESVNFRIAYKLLNNIGLTGTEADRKPVGYQQIAGPAPMLVYRRPTAPPPRRFPHFSDSAEKKETESSSTPEHKSAPTPSPAPVALPGLPASPSATQPSPDEHDEAGILPDPAQVAAQSRNDEMLSYFQRPNPTNRPQAPSSQPEGYGPGPNPSGGDPSYLQAPVENPLPPSRATYRVVPK